MLEKARRPSDRPTWRLETAQRAAVLTDERERRGAADHNAPASPGCLGGRPVHEYDARLTQTGAATADADNTSNRRRLVILGKATDAHKKPQHQD